MPDNKIIGEVIGCGHIKDCKHCNKEFSLGYFIKIVNNEDVKEIAEVCRDCYDENYEL